MDGQNVLVVEDDAALSELVREILVDAGYRPLVISDHALIAETVERWHPRCVLLDGELLSTGASRSWRDAAALRRADPALPVVLLTADPLAIAEARLGRSYRSRIAGFAGVIGKPFDVEELLAVVKKAVEGSSETDLFAMIVHELRQPLTVIRGQVQSARRHIGEDPAAQRLAMDRVIAQVDRMNILMAQLLDHARLATDHFILDVTMLDLAGLVAVAVGDHAYDRPIAFAPPTAPAFVYGDATRVAQILDNLLSNALKYSDVGTPIDVSLTTSEKDAQIRVADHGIGIPEEERALLFTPFYRTTRTRDIGGTGLGLYLSKQLAAHHGGRLWLERSSTEGSVFVLAIPLASTEPTPPAMRN